MKGKTLLAIVTVLLSIQYYIDGEPYMARHYAYPYEYRAVIQNAATSYGVPHSLVAAVVLTESKFQVHAQSGPGALGLMQLMPETAHWIAEQLNQPRMTDEDIKEPNTNIKLGTWYLAHLLQEFKGNKILALAAYNAGRGHVEEWMKENRWDYNFTDVNAIPFEETRNYVKSVLASEEKYRTLY